MMNMQRTKLANRKLPNYTVGEETANCISHATGVAMSLPVLLIFPAMAAAHGNLTGIVGSVIFGSSLVLLYAVSAIYHGLPQDTYIKKVFQVIDHCTIFLLIAGSYTAFVMGTLYWAEPLSAICMLAIIWTTAIVGIVLNAIDLKKYAVFSMCCYLLMGWLIILKAKVLAGLMGSAALSMLVIGGVLYTVGAVFYVIGRKKRYRHFVFHIFTLLGSLAHIICAGMCVV